MSINLATKLYYRSSSVVMSFIFIAFLAYVLMWGGLPTRYLGFLKQFPGIFIIYVCVVLFVIVLILRLPTFVRAVFRIPAVEFDGEFLLVRGWNDLRLRTTSSEAFTFYFNSSKNEVIFYKSGKKYKSVYIGDIDGSRSFVDLLGNIMPRSVMEI